MTQIYDFKTPSEMTTDILSDIVADLTNCGQKYLRTGHVINYNKLTRASNLVKEVISRDQSESDFLETHHESF